MKLKSIFLLFVAIIANISNAGEMVTLPLKTEFDLKEIEWFKAEGSASITGEASLTLKNGTILNCSGYSIELIPTSKYADERIFLTYGNNEFGKVYIEDNPPKFSPDAPEYHSTVRKTICNSEGVFNFRSLPEGSYYLFAFLFPQTKSSEDSTRIEGGALMRKVTLQEKEYKKIELFK
ncbi:hypothetical protein [Saccharophagus degradans]|nr:hypothetical protein [Saccharophagus degradans]